MKLTLARPRPLIFLRCLRSAYRQALLVRELEASAQLAEARQELCVGAILDAGRAQALAGTAGGT